MLVDTDPIEGHRSSVLEVEARGTRHLRESLQKLVFFFALRSSHLRQHIELILTSTTTY